MLASWLDGYQDRDYLLRGFSEGFLLDFSGSECPVTGSNARNTVHNKVAVETKLHSELECGRYAGPFDRPPPFDNIKCTPLALREKSTPGTWRLTHNLSFPYDETSTNAGIPSEKASVKYANIGDAIVIIQILKRRGGRRVFMAKCDIAEAFRNLPLHPSQYHLVGFMWLLKYYYDRCLPMGASSSCRIFERFSDALKWILETKFNCPFVVKILDDFFFLADSYDACLNALDSFRALCRDIGLPLAPAKTVLPCERIEFLGIELDSANMVAVIPEDQIDRYEADTRDLLVREKATLRELIGKLNFATSIVNVGRPFLRRLYDATAGVAKPFYKVRLL